MSSFREPAISLPEWIEIDSLDDFTDAIGIQEPDSYDARSEVYLPIHHAETLLRALLEVCPNAQHIVTEWKLAAQCGDTP